MSRLASYFRRAHQSVARLLGPDATPRPCPFRTQPGVEVLENRLVPSGIDTHPDVAYQVVNSWNGGLQGQLNIVNDEGGAITNWQLAFAYPGTITNIWNAQILSHQGNQYQVQGLSWDSTINAGASQAIGFTASPALPTDLPTNFVLDWSNGTTPPPPPPPPVTPGISVGNVTVTEGNPQTGTASGFFHTSGNQILDANNRPVRISGINWFGLETTDFAPQGLWARNYKDMMNQMKQLGFNTIRLPFSDQLFDPSSVPNSIDYTLNPDLQGLTGLQIMDKVVAYAGQIGMRILLDDHRSDAGNGPNSNGLWYTSAYPQSTWIADWTMLAARYANNPTVIGADLEDEPHDPATWGGGGPDDWRLAAEQAGNAILAANPNWLIIVEGVQTTSVGSDWWGGNLSEAGALPVTLNLPGHVVYSPHDYPSSVSSQPWFSAANYPANLPAVWNQFWGYLFQQGTAPVLLGEFGSTLTSTSDQQWASSMIAYLDGGVTGGSLPAGEQGISWMWWSWNPNSSDTGGILNNDWTTVNQAKINLLQPAMFSFGSGGNTPNSAVFTVTLSQASTQTITVQYATADGTALQGSDYVATSGTLTFAPGQTTLTVWVPIIADTTAEPTETFTLNLSNPSGATLANSQGIGTILDDDTAAPPPPPALSIGNVSVVEGNSGTTNAVFTVKLSAASTQPVTVAYATANGTATAGSDYLATSGTLTFAPGQTQQTITVAVLGDTVVEPNETFSVILSQPINATIATGTGTGTILNDDTPPPAANKVKFIETSDWGSGFTANMTITNNGTTPITGWTIEFDLAANITNIWNAVIVSHVGNHYVIEAASWDSTIAPGQTITFGFQGAPGLGTIGGPLNLKLNGVLV